MSIAINRVILVGNLTRDPELRHTQGGTAVCDFSLALNSREKVGEDEWGDRVDYFDVRAWGHLGENCAQYLAKGRKAAVDGRLRLETWEKDGTKHRKVFVVATDVQFIGQGGEGRPSDDAMPDADFAGATSTSGGDADFGGGSADDDIPF